MQESNANNFESFWKYGAMIGALSLILIGGTLKVISTVKEAVHDAVRESIEPMKKDIDAIDYKLNCFIPIITASEKSIAINTYRINLLESKRH